MNHDINVKKMRLNCFRQSKVPGEFMLQMRVPGGMVDAKYLSYVEHIANTWGDGNFHFGTRQTFDITGIKYENIPAVNEYLEQYIKEVDAELCGVNMDTVAHEPQPWDPKAGYPTIGARNITACVGNYHCICGNCNTFELARKIEPIIFPSHYHIKINIAGCPNDCNKAHLCDFGIIGVARMTYHPDRCIGCGACVASCKNASAMLFTSAKIAHLNLLPQGQPERSKRVLAMMKQMEAEGFGNCTNQYECEAACPKGISVDNIARLNRDFMRANAKEGLCF